MALFYLVVLFAIDAAGSSNEHRCTALARVAYQRPDVARAVGFGRGGGAVARRIRIAQVAQMTNWEAGTILACVRR